MAENQLNNCSSANRRPPAASLQTFLSSLLPAMAVPEDKLTRWHPRFNVDTVPAIQASALPQPPHTEKLATAQEVLDKARSLMTPKVANPLSTLCSVNAVVALAAASLLQLCVHVVSDGEGSGRFGFKDGRRGSREQSHGVATKFSHSSDLIAGSSACSPEGRLSVPPGQGTSTHSTDSHCFISPCVAVFSILSIVCICHFFFLKIRAKEAQKLQAAMTRNPAQEDRLLMMSRLPELARILRTVFVAEKKPALIMEVACNRMIASYRSALSTGEVQQLHAEPDEWLERWTVAARDVHG